MSWMLPIPLLLFAGVVALLPLASVVRRPVSLPRLMAEAFAIRRGYRACLARMGRALAD